MYPAYFDFGSAAPQAEPQADMALAPANAATYSRLLMTVTSFICQIVVLLSKNFDIMTSLVYT